MAGLSIPLNEVVHFDAVTHNPSTGAVTDADSSPTWSVFEENTDTAILSGSMTKRSALTGDYRASFTASAANGFELGKFYSVVCQATVVGVTGKLVAIAFRVTAEEATAGYAPLDSSYDPAKTAAQASVCTEARLARLDADVSSRLAASAYTAPDNAGVLAIKTKTDQLSFAGADVRATLDGETVALDADQRNALADAVLRRDVSQVEDTAPEHSLCFAVLAMSESNTVDHAGSLTVYKTDGVTEFARKELLTGENVQFVTGIR